MPGGLEFVGGKPGVSTSVPGEATTTGLALTAENVGLVNDTFTFGRLAVRFSTPRPATDPETWAGFTDPENMFGDVTDTLGGPQIPQGDA